MSESLWVSWQFRFNIFLQANALVDISQSDNELSSSKNVPAIGFGASIGSPHVISSLQMRAPTARRLFSSRRALLSNVEHGLRYDTSGW